LAIRAAATIESHGHHTLLLQCGTSIIIRSVKHWNKINITAVHLTAVSQIQITHTLSWLKVHEEQQHCSRQWCRQWRGCCQPL